jgi:hypothetical protein
MVDEGSSGTREMLGYWIGHLWKSRRKGVYECSNVGGPKDARGANQSTPKFTGYIHCKQNMPLS